MPINIEEIPRANCFEGKRISLEDTCGNQKCQMEDCMWREGFVRKTSGLDLLENKTEAKSTGMYD